ncbi:MAG: chemotaxis protein CheX [Oscillospiraceae bacterium]|nr:chemotaxis protein CheX [Oscillospiraceae bacterium]
MKEYTLDKIATLFSDALVDVLTTATGLGFSIVSEESTIELDDLVSFLSLYGDNNGMLFISANEAVSRKLCASMTGGKDDEVSPDEIDDALCELANMTAGNAKLRFNAAGTLYTLSPLFILRGKDMSIQSKKRVSIVTRHLMCDNMSIKLKVVFY